MWGASPFAKVCAAFICPCGTRRSKGSWPSARQNDPPALLSEAIEGVMRLLRSFSASTVSRYSHFIELSEILPHSGFRRKQLTGCPPSSLAPGRRQSHLHCKKADRSPETNLRFADRPRGSRALWRALAKALKGTRSFDSHGIRPPVRVRFLSKARQKTNPGQKRGRGSIAGRMTIAGHAKRPAV